MDDNGFGRPLQQTERASGVPRSAAPLRLIDGSAAPLGEVLEVSGARMTVALRPECAGDEATGIGAMIIVPIGRDAVIGSIAGVEVERGQPVVRRLVVDLLGEIVGGTGGAARFRRGVAHYPVSGAPVFAAGEADAAAVYSPGPGANIRIGALHGDHDRPAYLQIDELLAKHFAVLGTTGSGKSCAVTLILSAILADHPNAHILLLDPHNEYAHAFGERAELVNVDNLQLPFWLFNFEESVAILVRGGTPPEQEVQASILKDAITKARRNYVGDDMAAEEVTVDTPVPFRISDLLRLIEDQMGRLDNPDTSAPYLRLINRLESLRNDRRFAFMFSDWLLTRDTLSQVVGRLLRIPVAGRPITILDLSGVPSEIADVVVSLSCRLVFDFTLWSQREKMPPVLLVCEEAHHYVPTDPGVGFAATAEAIIRIAKEGRKYGVSLALVSQRPAELSLQAVSQCGTIFALRLGAHPDQEFMATAVPQAARGMLAALPSLAAQEAIVSGDAVPLPIRIRFDDLPPDRRPRGDSAQFSKSWRSDGVDGDFLAEGVRRWRLQTRKSARKPERKSR